MMFAPVVLRNCRRMSASVASSQEISTRPVGMMGSATIPVAFVDDDAVACAFVSTGDAIVTVGAFRAASAESSSLSRSISSVSDATTGAGDFGASFFAGSAAKTAPQSAASARTALNFSFMDSLLCQISYRPRRVSPGTLRGCARASACSYRKAPRPAR